MQTAEVSGLLCVVWKGLKEITYMSNEVIQTKLNKKYNQTKVINCHILKKLEGKQ